MSGPLAPDPVGDFLAALEIPDTASVRTQLRVFVRALQVFAERNARYKDVFIRSGWRGALFDVRKKAERVWQCWWREGGKTPETKDPLDDAYDLINHTAFFIRNANDGNELGDW